MEIRYYASITPALKRLSIIRIEKNAKTERHIVTELGDLSISDIRMLAIEIKRIADELDPPKQLSK